MEMNRTLYRMVKNDTWNRDGIGEGGWKGRLHIMLHDALCNVMMM